MGLFGSDDKDHKHHDDDDGHKHHDDDDGHDHDKFKLPDPGDRFHRQHHKPKKLPLPGGHDKFHPPPSPDPDKHHHKGDDDDTKDDDDGGNTTDRVKQGRWRTVTTEKVPRQDLTAPEEQHVEHRPLGF